MIERLFKGASERLPLGRALGWIVLSTIMVSGSAGCCWYYYQHLHRVRSHDPMFNITTVVQTGPEREALRTAYLEELLGLSADHPTNMYTCDASQFREKLLESPVIKEATVKSFNPGTLYIDYTVRKPVAYVGDYSNTVVDEEGVLFPSEPFYTPKRLPELYLGLAPHLSAQELWGQQTRTPEFAKALALMDATTRILGQSSYRIVKVDVAKAFADSYGKRQLVLVLEESFYRQVNNRNVICVLPYILRLHTHEYEAALQHFLSLREHLHQRLDSPPTDQHSWRYPPVVVDMRLPNLAYFGGMALLHK